MAISGRRCLVDLVAAGGAVRASATVGRGHVRAAPRPLSVSYQLRISANVSTDGARINHQLYGLLALTVENAGL